jgi:hypothetical protein
MLTFISNKQMKREVNHNWVISVGNVKYVLDHIISSMSDSGWPTAKFQLTKNTSLVDIL